MYSKYCCPFAQRSCGQKAGNIPSTHVCRQDATEWGVVVRDGPILHHMWVQTCQSNVSSSKLCPLSYGTFPHGEPKCSAPWRSFRIPSPTGCGCRGSAQGDCLPQDCYNLPADGLLAAPLATMGIPDLFQSDWRLPSMPWSWLLGYRVPWRMSCSVFPWAMNSPPSSK